jgi:hypothetical protein
MMHDICKNITEVQICSLLHLLLLILQIMIPEVIYVFIKMVTVWKAPTY